MEERKEPRKESIRQFNQMSNSALVPGLISESVIPIAAPRIRGRGLIGLPPKTLTNNVVRMTVREPGSKVRILTPACNVGP